MAVFKRNLWTLFWLLLLGGVILLLVILHYRWQSINNHYQTYHKNRAELVAQAVDSVLRTQELVLDVIGRELLNREEVFKTSRQMPLLDNVLAVDTTLVGFGLARPDGKLVRVSSNLNLDRLPNLRTNPSTGESFEQALSSEQMVLGRTYFVEALDEWVIPIRKALRDDTGQVTAVMTAGLRISSEGTVFARTLHDGPDDSVTLYREADNYVQFMSKQDTGPEVFAHAWVTPEQRQAQQLKLEAQLGITEAEVKARPGAIVIT
ncbi:MAG: cache domain-containing protein, partial [Marinobacterium sp.]